jgi:HK97 gp10 family phage protein
MKLFEFVKRLFKKSKNLDNELQTKLDFISQRLKDRARLNATIDPKKRTGRLYDSISSNTKKTGDGIKITLQAGSSSVNYAGYVEFGTSRMYPRLYLHKARLQVQETLPKEMQKLASIYLRTI